jgi:hypothetical protein
MTVADDVDLIEKLWAYIRCLKALIALVSDALFSLVSSGKLSSRRT